MYKDSKCHTRNPKYEQKNEKATENVKKKTKKRKQRRRKREREKRDRKRNEGESKGRVTDRKDGRDARDNEERSIEGRPPPLGATTHFLDSLLVVCTRVRTNDQSISISALFYLWLKVFNYNLLKTVRNTITGLGLIPTKDAQGSRN